ncbi:ribosomal protein S18 [Paramyrothecium foliicola]|nr:ribosomal protein S18 [Paramyrothecium foliicola]
MPPRLPSVSALRASTQSLFPRLFSTTAPAANPPHPTAAQRAPRSANDAGHHGHHAGARTHSSSSSSSGSILGMVERSSRAKRSPAGHAPGQAMASVLNKIKRNAAEMNQRSLARLEQQRNEKISKDYLKQMPRTWAVGDVYSPHDMSPVEMQKWRRRSKRTGDVIDALGIRPLDMYTNFSLISDFTSSSGMIKHSSTTSLRPVNQRKIAKMVRRAQGLGLYPTIHAHPELIRADFLPQRRMI